MISQQHHAFCAPQVASPPLSQEKIRRTPATTKAATTIYPTIANIISSSSSLSLTSANSSVSPLASALPSPSSEFESSPTQESFWNQSPEPELEADLEAAGDMTPWWRDHPHQNKSQELIVDAHNSDNSDQRLNRPLSYPVPTPNSNKITNTMTDCAYRIEELNDVDDVAPIGLGLRERAWSYSYPPPSMCGSNSPPSRGFGPYPRLPPIAPKGVNVNGGSSAPSSLPSASTLCSLPADLPRSLQYRRSSASSTTTTSSCSSTSSFVGPIKSYLKASQARRRKVILPPYFDRMSDAQKRLYECHPPSPIHSDDGDDSESSSSDVDGSCSSAPSSAPGSPIIQRRLCGHPSSVLTKYDQENERELDHEFGSALPPPPQPPHHSLLVPRPQTMSNSPHSNNSTLYHHESHNQRAERGYNGHLYRSSSTGSTYSSSGSTPSPARSPSTFFGSLPSSITNAPPIPPMKPRRRVRASPPGGILSLPSTDLLNGGPGTVVAPDGSKVIKNKDGSIMVYNPQTDSVTFRCELCPGESFGRIHDLKRHQTSKHQEMTWPCDFCHRPFVRRDALLRHYTVKAARDDGLHPAAHEVEKLMAARARAKMIC